MFICGLLCAGAHASAAWIYFSETVELPAGAKPFWWTPTRKGYLLNSSEMPNAPIAVEISAGIDAIEWTQIVRRAKAESLQTGFMLQGREAIPLEEGRRTVESKPGVKLDLLRVSKPRAYGIEERVRFEMRPGLEIQVSAGVKPAGVVLDAEPFELAGGAWQVEMIFSGEGKFTLNAAAPDQAKAETSTRLGSLRAQPGERSEFFDLPLQTLQQFVLAAPSSSATLKLRSLRVVPKSIPTSASGTATWLWARSTWLEPSEELLRKLERAHFKTIYVSIQLDEAGKIRDADQLRHFIAAAAAHHLSVWMVDGDPYAVLGSEQPKFVQRARAMNEFNAGGGQRERFGGAQWDIEPFLIPGFDTGAGEWLQAYLETVQAIRSVQAAPLELCVPFWFAEIRTPQGPLLDALATKCDGLAIMDYRTDPDLIRNAAEPFLAWGEINHKRIKIALELGPIDDEKREHFRPQTEGTVWLLPFAEEDILVRLKSSVHLPFATGFFKTHETIASGNRITFQKKIPTLKMLMPELIRHFSQWTSFDGMALHEAVPVLDQIVD